MKKSRIGVLGGTFNPVHLGHLALARSALEAFGLDRVLFVPCSTPAHKVSTILAAADHRVAMLEAAIADEARFEISDIELRRGNISYSVQTMGELREMYPGSELIFIIGSDSVSELYLWKDIYRLLELCRFGIFGRPGFKAASLSASDVRLDAPWPERLLESVRDVELMDVSSSEIRHRIAEGSDISGLVPDAVEEYILEHSLYGEKEEKHRSVGTSSEGKGCSCRKDG